MEPFVKVRFELENGVTVYQVAERIDELYGTANLESEQVEGLLPRVSTPPRNNMIMTKMPESYAKEIEHYTSQNGFEGLAKRVEVLWPYETNENGEVTSIVYEDWTWEEEVRIDGKIVYVPILNDNGESIGSKPLVVTKRLGLKI